MKKKFLCILLSAMMTLSFIPAAAFADMEDISVPEVKAGGSDRGSIDRLDSDDLLMQYIDYNVEKELGSDDNRNKLSASSVHKRRDVIAGVAANMYDAMAPSVIKVASGELSSTSFAIPASQLFGEASFDAEDLEMDSLLEDRDTIKAEAFNRFVPTLNNSLSGSLKTMLGAMIADMPYELYWLDNVNGIDFNYTEGWLENNMRIYDGGSRIGIKTDDTLVLTFNWYVSQDYSYGGSPNSYGPEKTTTVNTDFTSAAAKTAKNISGIIKDAEDENDVGKLVYYKNTICNLVTYNDNAWNDDWPYGDPWQLIYVFDNDPATNVVCEGYSRAFQYLCDNTDFYDKTVESRLVSGTMSVNAGRPGNHMWNILHMDDGYNYIADITNCDGDEISSYVFLSAPLSGTVENGYTFRFRDGTLKYNYGEDITDLFSAEELSLSNYSYPNQKGDDSDAGHDQGKAGEGSTGHDQGKDGDSGVTPVSIENAKVVLSTSALTYNGRICKPEIITIGGKNLKSGTDYTVQWAEPSSKNVGSYTITITGKGNYTGVTKAVYQINPKGTAVKKPAGAKKAITVKWKMQSDKMEKSRITGYQIQLATDRKFTHNKKTVNVKGYRKVSKKVKILKGKKKYYIRIRTYMTVGGKKYYSDWSKVRAA